MRKRATLFFGVLLLACSATLAHATQYPPGPGGACLDSLTIAQIQNPAEACHPAVGDSVHGVHGFISGFDPWTSGFAVYIQDMSGNPWTGIDVFTGGTNWQPLFSGAACPGAGYCGGSSAGLAIGDELVVYGRTDEFSGGSEITAYNGAFGSNLVIRRLSTGNGEPPTHVGTVNELYVLPTNPNGEKWEGVLVQINGPLRVTRNTGSGGILAHSFMAVDNVVCPPGSPGPCDSLFVDQNTLDAQRPDPPPIGTIVAMVKGIFEQRAYGYHIETRGSADIDVPLPPALVDAYHVHADTIRCVFDRDLDPVTAQDENNYTILSVLDIPDNATLVEPNVVHLAYSNPLGGIALENVTANPGIKSAGGQASTSPTARDFFSGVLSAAEVQAPNPDSLAGVPCVDRSRLAGPAGETSQGQLGDRFTMRGVCTAKFGANLYMLNDAAGGPRSGVTVFAPAAPLIIGHQYMFVGNVQEFFSETEAAGNVYLRDEGAVAMPVPVGITMPDIQDWTCDVAQSFLNPEDFESTLSKLTGVYSVEDRLAGESFFVGGPEAPNYLGTFLVAPRSSSYTAFAATLGHRVEVTGTLSFFNSLWRLNPRTDADIVDLGLAATGVGDHVNQVSFSVFPNPARQFQVAFGLPRASDVDLGVFDLVGRRVATIATGEMAAGEYRYQWAGELAGGGRAKPGLYFYRLTVDGQSHTQRGIFLE